MIYNYDTEASIAVDPETGMIAIFISDGLDGRLSILSKDFNLLTSFESGFSSGYLMSCKEALAKYKSGELKV